MTDRIVRIGGASGFWGAARYAGDEFVVLVNDVSDAHAADQVRLHVEQLLQEPLSGDTLGAAVGLSVGGAVGLAVCPTDADTVEGLLARADADMYARKAAAGKLARG